MGDISDIVGSELWETLKDAVDAQGILVEHGYGLVDLTPTAYEDPNAMSNVREVVKADGSRTDTLEERIDRGRVVLQDPVQEPPEYRTDQPSS